MGEWPSSRVAEWQSDSRGRVAEWGRGGDIDIERERERETR